MYNVTLFFRVDVTPGATTTHKSVTSGPTAEPNGKNQGGKHTTPKKSHSVGKIVGIVMAVFIVTGLILAVVSAALAPNSILYW